MLDSVLAVLNAFACLVLSAAASWAVLSPAVRDGVVVKAGLISVALGFLACAVLIVDDRWWALNRALALVHGGGVTVLLGYATRVRGGRRKRRRVTDWAALDGP